MAPKVMPQVIALKIAKEEAEALVVGQAVPADKCQRISSYMQSTETLLDEVNEFAGKAVKISTTLKPHIETALPFLLSAKCLFGMTIGNNTLRVPEVGRLQVTVPLTI